MPTGNYSWNLERLWKQGKSYVHLPQGKDNAVDTTMHVGAGAVHFATGIIDSTVGDLARALQGEHRVPLKRYDPNSLIPRLKLDAKEAVSSITGVFRGKFLGLLNLPIIAFKAVGDGIADGADALAGIDHRMAA